MKENFLILTSVFFLLEIYVYQAIKTVIPNLLGRRLYLTFHALLYTLILYVLITYDRNTSSILQSQITVVLFLTLLVPKLLTVVLLLIDDVWRMIHLVFSYFSTTPTYLPERRKFLSLIGLGSAGLLSTLFLDGVLFGKYRHKVRKVRLKIKNLPKNFKGYKIVQISDVHSGSFLNPELLRPAFELINAQKADLVLFTGDLVNNRAEEFRAMMPLFSSIKAKDAKLSVLGNHDYGLYVEWPNAKDKSQNLNQLIDYQKQTGFKVLRNTHHVLEREGEKLYIIGVDNWGRPPFPQYGDLDKAVKNIPKKAAKILMSHDPTHFDDVVKNHSSDIALTLSGHTHGMQFGLDLKNARWSPVQYRYEKWIDLYESHGKYLYVNRGFGVIGYPGRVGILPEITLFELE